MKTFLNLWLYLRLRMRNVLDESCREKQNTLFMFSNFLPKIVPLWDNVEKYVGAREAADDNMAHARLMLYK
jgi:hypothetical protein